MSDSVAVVWHESLQKYDFGPGHPFSPIRQQLTMRLVEEFGLLDHSNVSVVSEIPVSGDATLLTVHRPALLEAVKAASSDPDFEDASFGLGTPDNPVFPDMHSAAARICGASVVGAEAVLSGRAGHAVNISGGLHHAMPDRVSGFCVYNDAAVAIRWLLDQGLQRIAYLDVDVHHGDGVQVAFWDDPRVLTISIHESPSTQFPGTGWPTEIGGPRALGSAVNIALPAGTGDQGWLRGLHAVAPSLLREFKPQFLVSQHGCDTHFEDPLGNLTVSIDGERLGAVAAHNWAHRFAGGNWLALGGGGYEWVDVVPRAWTHLMAEAIGRPIDPQTPVPDGFRSYCDELLGREPPALMTDGFEPWPKLWDLGYDPDDPVDAAIAATRRAVFPYHGLPVDGWQGF
ncbi:MAG: acetoin utilization protein AcuC [Candidatus Nanopelagicales bacterium]|nr:acetoin utilization protein AcuC [Candidatus Nanopelagicales bacterium]